MTNAVGAAQPIQSEAPEWVHLLPTGMFRGDDGRGPYHADPAALVATFQEAPKGRPLVVDFAHQTHPSTGTGSVASPAAGWIVEMQARQDGVWGRVEWTPVGLKALKNKEYRYLSPVFRHRQDGTIIRIMDAGLVNNPNLSSLQPVMNSAGEKPGESEPVTIDRLVRKARDEGSPDLNTIMANFGLPAPETSK